MPFIDYSNTAPDDFKSNLNSLASTYDHVKTGIDYTTMFASGIATATGIVNVPMYKLYNNTTVQEILLYLTLGVNVLSTTTLGILKFISSSTKTKIESQITLGKQLGFFRTPPDVESLSSNLLAEEKTSTEIIRGQALGVR